MLSRPRTGGRRVASRRTVNVLISGILFLVVAFVVGFITAAFTDSWVWPVVAGVVAGSAAEWVYVAVKGP
jgi:hypothetical protein